MKDIIKIVKSLEESGLSIKAVSETIKDEGGFLGILLSTLGASLLGAQLTGKRKIGAGEGTIKAGVSTIRAGQNF